MSKEKSSKDKKKAPSTEPKHGKSDYQSGKEAPSKMEAASTKKK